MCTLKLHICECLQTLAYIWAMGTHWHTPSQTTPHPLYHSTCGQVTQAPIPPQGMEQTLLNVLTQVHGLSPVDTGLNHALFSLSFAKHSWSLLRAYPRLHSHCHTPTCRLNHFRSLLLFLISFSFAATHAVILAALSLPLTHTLFPGFPQAGLQPPPQCTHWEKAISCMVPSPGQFLVPHPAQREKSDHRSGECPAAHEARQRDGRGQRGFVSLSQLTACTQSQGQF